MQVKSRQELELQDLPNIESPSSAFHRSPGNSFEVKRGSLFLVCDGLLDKPDDPLVVWEADSDHPNGGFWRLKDVTSGAWRLTGGDSFNMMRLGQDVEALNRWGITPDNISVVGPGGYGHMDINGMIMRRSDERDLAKQEASRKLTLPLGAAASVAPLASSATPPPAPERKTPEEKEKQRKPVHLEVGIFTDGTLNNAGNIDIFHQRVEDECLAPHRTGDIDEIECERRLALLLGDSYANGTSNIAKLRDLYTESRDETETTITWRRRIYVPGAGSKTGDPDSLEGMMTGLGETGVIAQVKNAFSEIARRASALVNNNGGFDALTVDLFGFSRGAAAARHAANDIISGSGGELGQALAANGMPWPENVSIRFLGLFDTVAGIMNIREGDFTPSNDSNAPVNLYLDPATLSRVVQFRAMDECRENFALNSLYGPDGTLPGNFREIELPGVHSDIGGGYHDSQTEQLLLSPTLTVKGSATAWPEQTPQWDNLATLKAIADAEGWVGPQSLPLPGGESASLQIHKTVREHPVPDGQVNLDLKLHRQVRGELSQAYLHCMYHLAKEAGVPLGRMDPTDNATAIPKELDLAYRLLWEQIWHSSDKPELPPVQHALLKQRYVHHSDQYNLHEFLIGDTIGRSEIPFANAAFLSPFRPARDRKRIVYPNKPEA